MDTELARTFLAVVTAGSFVEAAERLHVTQSTVSARIQRLEGQLGTELFLRNKAGTTLTPAGRKFQRYATLLTRTVAQARQEIGSVGGFHSTLSIGARIALWEGDLLTRWLPDMARLAPDVAVRAQVFGFDEELMEALIDGRTDIGVMYNPQSRPGLTVEPLFEERLVMVSSRDPPPAGPEQDYVYVDWGPEFLAHHGLAFPGFTGSALGTNVGWLGLEHILAAGGSGYFPMRLVQGHEASGKLHRVVSAPEFRLPVYLVHPGRTDSSALMLALDSIQRAVTQGTVTDRSTIPKDSQSQETSMSRMVKRTHHEPYKLSIGGTDKYLCRCGLSKNQPFCDGSHKLTLGESPDKLYWYDDAGTRHECSDSFQGVRTY